MSTIVTRAGKGSALTFNEVDSNFINLNTDKIQSGNTVPALTITSLTAGGTTLLGFAGEGGQISLNNADNASTGMIIDVASAEVGRIFSVNNNFTLQLGQLGGTNGNIQLFTSASERMRIDANGNVGIGTNSPTAKLEVEGGVSAKQADGRYFGFGTTNFSMDGTLINDYGITYNQISSTFNTVLAGFSNIKFATGRSEKMRIDPNGNVGIGTNTPVQKLDVVGNIGAGAAIFTGTGVSTEDVAIEVGGNRTGVGNAYLDLHAASGTDYQLRLLRLAGVNGQSQLTHMGTGALVVRTEEISPLVFATNNAEKMRITSDGNVGVGTSSPTNFGATYKTMQVSGSNGGVFRSSGTNVTADFYVDDTANQALVRTTTNHPLVFRTNDTERMRIDPSGNVGIGTSTPFGRFDITGVAGNITVATIQSVDGSMSRINLANTNRNWTISNYGSQFSPNGAFVIADEQAAAVRLLIDTSGKVGVGAAFPDTKLHVFDNTAVDIRTRTGNLLQALDVGVDASGNGLIAGSGNYPVIYYTNSIERMRITSAGNVGIGSSVAGNILTVSGDKPIRAQEGSGTYYYDFGRDSPTGAFIFNGNQSGTAAYVWQADGVERMRVDASGNVGIGTGSPAASALLDVQSTTKGVRMPNMTTTQKNAITSPAAGLMVFDTDLTKLCVYTGAAWQTITST